MTENEISRIVFESALKVHKKLGPGLLESVYEECLFYELSKFNIAVYKKKPLSVRYDQIVRDVGYRVDLMVNEKVIVELKSVDSLLLLYMAQVLTYLKITNCKLGILINFNVSLL